MSDFTMPSVAARAASPELDRVCRELEQEREARRAAQLRSTSLADSLEILSIWVDSALNCTSWHWDPHQHEAATDCLNEAKALLAAPSAGEAAMSAKLDQLVKASRALRIEVGGDANHDRLCELLAECRAAEEALPMTCLDQRLAEHRAEVAHQIADKLAGLEILPAIKELDIVSRVRSYGNPSPQQEAD